MKVEDLPRQVLEDLTYDYRNEWSGLAHFFREDKAGKNPREIKPDDLRWILRAYNNVPDLDGFKSTYEISKFVDRMNNMFARGGARPMPGWDQIDPLVFKPSEDAAEKVNEQLHCLARIWKLRFADLNYDQAAQAMCGDKETLDTIEKLRTAFGEFVNLIDKYREVHKSKK